MPPQDLFALPADAGARILPLAREIAAILPDPALFERWGLGLVGAIAAREMHVWVDALELPTAAFIFKTYEGLATVLAGFGRVDDAFLKRAIAGLQADHAALIWDESCGADWPARLADVGIRPYVLQTFVQDLTTLHSPSGPADRLSSSPLDGGRCPSAFLRGCPAAARAKPQGREGRGVDRYNVSDPPPLPPTGTPSLPFGRLAHKGGGKHLNYHPNEEIHLRPWQASDLAAVAPVVAAAHAGALSGLLLTTPAAPTAAGLERFVSGLLAGESGAFLPDFSFIAELNGRSVGLVLAIRDAEGQPTLLELATHPSVQGRGVGRRLVIAMQQALLAAGETRMVFITTGDNSPVHRLFTPDEILSRSEARGGYWLEG